MRCGLQRWEFKKKCKNWVYIKWILNDSALNEQKNFQPKFPRFNFVTIISAWTTQWQDVIQEFWPKINLVSLSHRHFKIHILYTNLEHFFFATLDCFPSKSASHIWQGEFWSPKIKPRGSSQLEKCVEFCETKIDFWWMMSSQLGTSLPRPTIHPVPAPFLTDPAGILEYKWFFLCHFICDYFIWCRNWHKN